MSSDTDSSSYAETEAGRDVSVAPDTREMYDQLVGQEDSPFYQAQRMDVFMFALGYGCQKAGRVPQGEGKKHALFNRSSLSEQQEWIIKSIGVKEERSADVLRDESLVYQIAQEYANGGIRELHNLYVSPDDAFSELSTELIERNQDFLTSEE